MLQVSFQFEWPKQTEEYRTFVRIVRIHLALAPALLRNGQTHYYGSQNKAHMRIRDIPKL